MKLSIEKRPYRARKVLQRLEYQDQILVCVCVVALTHMNYEDIISIENLFQAWSEFRKGKSKRRDVQVFERNLEDNLFELHEGLLCKTYKHGDYKSFYVHDPKQRHIHKAQVVDRVVHHLLYKFLYGLFDKIFTYDSYSCRLNKGTHKAVDRLERFTKRVSVNYTKPCWALKCDIKKFFATINHEILLSLLKQKISDGDILWLLEEVIGSFHSEYGSNKGIPLGNLTSQIFANIYLNELDKFVKHNLKVKHYIRYCDDFIILSNNQSYLLQCIDSLKQFLELQLKLELHPKKISVKKLRQGIDFLGYIVLPYYRLTRNKTRKRILQKLRCKIGTPAFTQSYNSYLGYLVHSNSYGFTKKLGNEIWLWGLTC